MPTLILRTYDAKREDTGYLQVIFHLNGTPDPFPRRNVEIHTTADALAALETYKAEAAATGKPLVASMSLKDGDRAPAGFRKAERNPCYHPANV